MTFIKYCMNFICIHTHTHTHTHTQLIFQSVVTGFYHHPTDVCICRENFTVNEFNKIRTHLKITCNSSNITLHAYLTHLPMRDITTQAKVDNKTFPQSLTKLSSEGSLQQLPYLVTVYCSLFKSRDGSEEV
jgi:hypothetical protein